MIEAVKHCRMPLSRSAMLAGLGMLGLALAGCAGGSNTMAGAFADPALYDLYNCQQLVRERTVLGKRETELRGLMAKAGEGPGGTVIAEAAYRPDLLSTQGQRKMADDAWRDNHCDSDPKASAEMQAALAPASAPAQAAAPSPRGEKKRNR